MNELRKALEEYLSIRRKLGFKLQRAGKLLHDFVLFAEKEGASFITVELALRWATQSLGCQTAWSAARLGIVRGFAQYQSVIDPRTEIPSQELLPYRYHRRPPYIYSNDEVIRLIKAAQQLQSPLGLRAATYSTVFGLLAVSGMRISEPIGLNHKDVDLMHGITHCSPKPNLASRDWFRYTRPLKKHYRSMKVCGVRFFQNRKPKVFLSPNKVPA